MVVIHPVQSAKILRFSPLLIIASSVKEKKVVMAKKRKWHSFWVDGIDWQHTQLL